MTTAKEIQGCCGQGCDDHSNRNINAIEQKQTSKSLFVRFVEGYIKMVSSMSKAPHVDWMRKI
mgnify:CR=1 FL=1